MVAEPCALCALILQLKRLSKYERLVYQQHLYLHHHVQEYHVDR
jgi:hypothetical protein